MPWPITFDEVLEAQERLGEYLQPTPLRNYPELDQAVGARVLVKHENHQPTNSFKIRNGLSALLALRGRCGRGIIAASTGNHGQGVAWAGQKLGLNVTICVPVGNNPEKNQAMRGLGARVIEHGSCYDEAMAEMHRLAEAHGLQVIHSTNDRAVIAGAATMTLEVVEQAAAMGESIDAMVLAVGGGSQAVGAMTVLRKLRPAAAVYGVQAAGASATHDSWRAGRLIPGTSVCTFADGIATRSPYEMTFDALRDGLSGFVLVTDAQIADAIRLLIRTTHNLPEGAGAAGLAGLRKLGAALAGKTVAIAISGGNIDQATLRDVMTGKL